MENYSVFQKHNKSLLPPPTSIMGPTVILLVKSIIWDKRIFIYYTLEVLNNYFKEIIYNLTAMSNKNQIVYTMSYVQNAKTAWSKVLNN